MVPPAKILINPSLNSNKQIENESIYFFHQFLEFKYPIGFSSGKRSWARFWSLELLDPETFTKMDSL
jgi:hypothetical protein